MTLLSTKPYTATLCFIVEERGNSDAEAEENFTHFCTHVREEHQFTSSVNCLPRPSPVRLFDRETKSYDWGCKIVQEREVSDFLENPVYKKFSDCFWLLADLETTEAPHIYCSDQEASVHNLKMYQKIRLMKKTISIVKHPVTKSLLLYPEEIETFLENHAPIAEEN